jgi:transmembrane sensor
VLGVWRAADDRNEVRYGQVARLWEVRGLLKPPESNENAPTARQLLGGSPRVARGGTQLGRIGRRWSPLGSVGARVAAAVVLLISGGVLGYLGIYGQQGTPRSLELMTAVDEMTSARLPDGSVVRLGPESRLHVEISARERRASLHGRAFFAVQHDPSRPFTVVTEAGEVVVRGTRFDLEARSGDLDIVVLGGAVGLAAGGEVVAVVAGQRSRVREGGRPEVVTVGDVFGSLGWIGDFVAFESTSLRDVAKELERRFDYRITISGEGLADETVTSWSIGSTPAEVLSAVCFALNALCTITHESASIDR